MRVLHADLCSSYPLARAGGHRTIHALLSELSREPDIACFSLTPRRGLGSQLPEYDPRLCDFEPLGIRSLRVEPERWIFDCGYPQWAVERVDAVLDEVLESFRPDVVWSNAYLSLPLLSRLRARGLPALWYHHDARPAAADLLAAAGLGIEPAAVSRFIAARVERESGEPCPVIYPAIREAEYAVPAAQRAPRYVTFINPRPVKGFEVFLELAPLLPEVPFLVVEAWPLGEHLAAVESALAALPNVTFWQRRADAREIYRETAVLLVPSVVEEGAGRVVREAQLNGIPVLTSRRGGLPEMLGDGGIVVGDGLDAHGWAAALSALLASPERLQKLSTAALANAAREELSTAGVVRRFRAALERARRRGVEARVA